MMQPHYIVKRYNKRDGGTRYHIIRADSSEWESLTSFTSLLEAAAVARYVSGDHVTNSERKIALEALKRAEGYSVSGYPDPLKIDTTIPEP